VVLWGNQLQTEDTKFIWYPFIPEEEITLLLAPPKVGKGISAASLAATVTTGGPWPCSNESAAQGVVLWLEAEDKLEATVGPRLIAAGADMNRMALMGLGKVKPPQLRAFILGNKVKLLVLSPLKSYIDVHYTNDESEVRKGMEDLHAAVKGTGCAILGIMHPNKKEGVSAMDRAAGSGAFTQYARSAILLRREKGSTLRRMTHGWTNVGEEGDDLLFDIEHIGDPRLQRSERNPRSQFVRAEWVRAGDRADVETFFNNSRDGEDDGTALEWLLAYLQGKGPVKREEVVAAGEKAGHTNSALRAAFTKGSKKKLLYSTSKGFGAQKETFWACNLPSLRGTPAERIEVSITRAGAPA
jgi:hypothetical protein